MYYQVVPQLWWMSGFLCSVWSVDASRKKRKNSLSFFLLFVFVFLILFLPNVMLFFNCYYVFDLLLCGLLQSAVFLPGTIHTLKQFEGLLCISTHRLLSRIQNSSVGCSIFLIVANFLVQFYANFTWML